MSNCTSLGTDEQKEKLNRLIKNASSFTIVKILQETQSIYGFLPEGALNYISKNLKIAISELYSVASFYAEFSFKPKGRYTVSVCMGTACYVNGAEPILNKICSLLKINAGETTKDNKFSIDQTRCIGCCGMAPVLTIGDDVYGNVKLADVEKIINSYMEK